MRAGAVRVSHGQVDLRQLVAGVDEISTFLGEDNVVAGQAVVAIRVGAGGEVDLKLGSRGFFVSSGEATGDGASFGGVFNDGGSRNGDDRDVVDQGYGRRGVGVRRRVVSVGDGQVDLRQRVAGVDEVSAFLGEDNVVAGQAVVAIRVGAGGEGDLKLGSRGFFVSSGEATGDGASFGAVFNDGGGSDGDDWDVWVSTTLVPEIV
ncbi:hypothetical protein AO262_19165 [Pseudomonas fluorescens ABAC62]|nr:hypothetical protein AO262_19165 [Pseudomonas fluorescens ABAC62]